MPSNTADLNSPHATVAMARSRRIPVVMAQAPEVMVHHRPMAAPRPIATAGSYRLTRARPIPLLKNHLATEEAAMDHQALPLGPTLKANHRFSTTITTCLTPPTRKHRQTPTGAILAPRSRIPQITI